MTIGDRRRRIESICEAALAVAPNDRNAFIATRCAGDPSLEDEVRALIAHARTADEFLGDGIDAVAAQVLTTTPGSLVGRDVGVYQITAFIGAGGMGEVYRARDSRLGRDVAIKILPASFSNDRERLARFEREARVLAALNHPHIASIYGVEDVDGATVLVLELVAGETLADRIARGPIPLREALPIARQIADALEGAHDKGIIHRDLKPANIALTKDGTVKVLDFGLAKAGDAGAAEVSQPPTLTLTGRCDGMLLGTAAYMSPEQARGQAVDKRADIWAFGCVLYEMLTGRAAFGGETTTDTLAAILEREPVLDALPERLPPRVRLLLRRCLQKDSKHRLHDIADVRLDLEDAAAPEQDTSRSAGRLKTRERIAWALAAVMAVVLVAAGVWQLRRAGPDLGPMRFAIQTPPSGDPASFALSADGRQLAFVASVDNIRRLWVRRLDQVAAQPLADTDGAFDPFWAPDGTAVGFFAGAKLKRINVAGGPAQVLADAPRATGGAWNRDGVILFAPTFRSPIMRIPATGGTAVAVTRLPGNASSGHRFPRFLPDGRRFLFTVWGAQTAANRRGVFVGSLDGREPFRVLGDAEGSESTLPIETANPFVADYGAPGALLIVRRGDLVAFPFDPVRAVVTGDPSPLVTGIGTDGAFAVSETGVLAHRSGTERRQLVWVDRSGRTQGSVGQVDDNALADPELAPDGRRVAVDRVVQGNRDIYIIDLGLGVPKRFTFDAAADSVPVWSPDGQRLVFTSNRNKLVLDIFEKPTSGSAAERPLLVTAAGGKIPVSWSPDGRFLLYAAFNFTTGVDDLWALPMVGERKPFPVLQAPFQIGLGQFSPDGRWLAYESTESGPVAVYVRPFPGPGGQWQVSTAGGSQPRWRPDGKELFYIAPDGRMMAMSIGVGADRETLEAGVPMPLFSARLASGGNLRNSVVRGTTVKPQYAVAPDGRFLMNVSVDSATPITVILNWSRELVNR